MPTTQEQTWENKGAKRIKVLRIEDKKQVTLVSSFAWMDCSYPFKLFLQIPCIKHYPQITKENSCASTIDGILPLMQIIGQPLRPQKDLFKKLCCHIYIHKLSIKVCQNIKKWYGCWIVGFNTRARSF
jgi:hypothetical protein